MANGYVPSGVFPNKKTKLIVNSSKIYKISFICR